jgi:hypothetical protein
LQDKTPLQIRKIPYNDEAAPCRRSNHLLETRWLPSSDDNDITSSPEPFSGTFGVK